MLKKIPVGKPGPDEILINIKFSGVCHSDVHAMNGDWPMPPQKMPLVGGHEGVGIVVAKGELVTNFELGDYAGVKWIAGTCGACLFCQDGHEQLCPNAKCGENPVQITLLLLRLVMLSMCIKTVNGDIGRGKISNI